VSNPRDRRVSSPQGFVEGFLTLQLNGKLLPAQTWTPGEGRHAGLTKVELVDLMAAPQPQTEW